MNRRDLIEKLRELWAGLRLKVCVVSTYEGRKQATEDAEMIQTAISMLTPRVLAHDELSERMTGWLEYMDEVIPVIGGKGVYGAHCFIDAMDRVLALVDDQYNVTWRVWTLEPTQEQREGVKWNESGEGNKGA